MIFIHMTETDAHTVKLRLCFLTSRALSRGKKNCKVLASIKDGLQLAFSVRIVSPKSIQREKLSERERKNDERKREGEREREERERDKRERERERERGGERERWRDEGGS